ncbi:MAG: glycoside hydrolase family 16 protein [Oceanipulchritudo sp.]
MRAFPRLQPGLCLVAGMLSSSLSGEDWILVWSDEFDYTGLPDSSKWGYDVGGWGWGNGELQYYTEAREKNARVEGGNLVIEVHEEEDYEGNINDYTSARLLTKGKHDWTYGRFEARIKVPEGEAGLWPAFWMLGSDIDSVGWPQCGEIDIMEYVSRQPNEIFGTIHGPGYSAGGSYGNLFEFGEPVSNAFHVFAVEWEPGRIEWFVDGILYHSAEPEDIVGTGRKPNEWVFDHDHFLILNVAVGGTFGGFLDENLTFPVRMLVDYVRVHTRDYGMFTGYRQDGFWMQTGGFLGPVNVEPYPWVYLDALSAYGYAAPSESSGGWIFLPK